MALSDVNHVPFDSVSIVAPRATYTVVLDV